MTRVSIKKAARPKADAGRASAPAVGARRRGRPAGIVLDRRELILTAALRMFAVQGYERTALKDIARVTGITHSAIYHYYHSKGQLLFEAVTYALGQLVSRLRQVEAAAFKHRSAYLAMLVRMQALFEVELRGVTPFIDSVLYGPLRDLADLSAAQKSELRSLQRELVDIYRGVLQDGSSSGEFQVRNVAVTAFSILGMVSHLAVWYREGAELSSESLAAYMGELAQRLVSDPSAP